VCVPDRRSAFWGRFRAVTGRGWLPPRICSGGGVQAAWAICKRAGRDLCWCRCEACTGAPSSVLVFINVIMTVERTALILGEGVALSGGSRFPLIQTRTWTWTWPWTRDLLRAIVRALTTGTCGAAGYE